MTTCKLRAAAARAALAATIWLALAPSFTGSVAPRLTTAWRAITNALAAPELQTVRVEAIADRDLS